MAGQRLALPLPPRLSHLRKRVRAREQSRAEQSRAEQSKAEQSRAEQNQSKAKAWAKA